MDKTSWTYSSPYLVYRVSILVRCLISFAQFSPSFSLAVLPNNIAIVQPHRFLGAVATVFGSNGNGIREQPQRLS